MNYTGKTNWAAGEDVTHTDMNRIEQGLEDAEAEINSGGGGGGLGVNVIDVTDYGSVAAAVSACTSGDILYFPPSATSYTASTVLSLPDNVGVEGYGATLRLQASNAQFHIPNPATQSFRGLSIHGGETALVPLKIGTAAGGEGAKSHFLDINVQAPGTGGTAVEVQNLQNSTFTNMRITNADLATTGFLIDGGSKNINIFGLWSSSINGPSLKITTSAGTQRTSKIYIFGGLMEALGAVQGEAGDVNDPAFGGIRLEDCEQVYLYNIGINGTEVDNVNAEQGIYCVGGGNRDTNNDGVGDGTKGPDNIYVLGCQFKNFKNAFRVDTGNTTMHVGSNSFLTVDNMYKVEVATGEIVEISPPMGDADDARFTTASNRVEHDRIRPFTPVTLTYDIGTEATAVTATTLKTVRAPFTFVVTKASSALTTASSSGNPTVDINDDGVSILGTNKLRIDANEKTSATAATATSIANPTIAADSEITIVGTVAGTGAAGLKVTLQGYRLF
jgi:hypothetical protein